MDRRQWHKAAVAALGVGGAAVIGGLAMWPALPGSKPAAAQAGASAATATSNTAPAGAPGMTVYIDPRTGAIVSEPAPGTTALTLTPREATAFSTSHEGLSQTPNAVPGGGVKLDLQGRFQNPLI